MGSNSVASASGSVALGASCTARATLQFTSHAQASGAVALGYRASSAGFTGSFVTTDAVNFTGLSSSANNQFSARYVGGYRLFTNSDANLGVQVVAGGNAWTVISDSTRKERVVLADGNRFLASIGALRLGSWNYKTQNAATMRHYDPVAQDFYAAFGHDGVGTIGNDTTINQADFDGVNLIAIQALYRRVQALEAENARQQQIQQLQSRQPGAVGAAPASTAALEERLRRLEAQLGARAQR